MFVNDGKDIITNFLLGSNLTYNPPAYMAAGSDITAVTVNDTGLGSEYLLTRQGFSSQTKQSNQVELEMVLDSTEPSDSMPCMMREVGVFDGSPTGSLFSRNIFAELEKTTDIEMQFVIGIRVI